MQYTREQLGEKFEQLPENLQEAIISVETAKIVSAISNKYGLHVDQAGELADEIGLIMLGLVKTGDFVTHLIARLGLDRPVAEAIAREVNEQIFLKIRESLQALHSESGEGKDSNYGVEMLPSTNAPTPAGAVLDKEAVIKDIENPPQTPEDSVFEQKMGKLFRIPREEVDLDPYLEKPK